ncbi:hypothetical protein OTU49_006364 [Cherax quadricarinatus]|uniref:Uncharacterized protein n=1 Tax=Cherax quadricarinatus TaxID=27406 RepID=A0AAW0WN60_CHEQU|nr:uncharacterized protein LOC128692317 [Cherax quadricarinatus]
MTGKVNWLCLVVLLLCWCRTYAQSLQNTSTSGLLQLSTSIAASSTQQSASGSKVKDGVAAVSVLPNSTVAVPHLECGYIMCEAPHVFINDTTHFWDYFIDWEMPSPAENDPSVFILANRYQLPRAYLVFKGFTLNFTGDYLCLLHFRRDPIASVRLTLTLDDTRTSRDCNNA